MDDQPDIRHIDAHAECSGGHHNPLLTANELQLVLLALVGVHIGMAFSHLVGELGREVIAHHVRVFSGGTVNDRTPLLSVFLEMVLQP